MKTAELFAGIGGFRVAAERLGWQTVWANDACPRACAVYRDRFGTGELCGGDILALRETVPPHDVLTAGFPCQPFSSAGKKEGVRDVRGTLFQAVVDVLARCRPRGFVLENVKRLLTMEKGWHFATILRALADLDYAIEWRLLNAVHFGLPQNRERVFLMGVRLTEAQCHRYREGESAPVRLATPEDLMALDGIEKARLFAPRDWEEVVRHRGRFGPWGLALSGRYFSADLAGFSAASVPVTLASVLETKVPDAFDFTAVTRQWVDANRPVNRFVNGVEIVSNQRGGARMGYTIFGINGVAPTLTSTTSRHYERYRVGDRYRRLTNVEYARLQGFPDDHCRAVPLYDQYALYGNAVPPPLAAWVLGRLAADGITRGAVPRRPGNLTLFDHAF